MIRHSLLLKIKRKNVLLISMLIFTTMAFTGIAMENKQQNFVKNNKFLVEIELQDLSNGKKLAINNDHTYSVGLSGQIIKDEVLKKMFPFKQQVIELFLRESGVDDAHMKDIASFSNLICLDLSQNYLTNKNLIYLKMLPKLKDLGIMYNKITYEGINQFINFLPALEGLDVSCNNLKNEGIQLIAQSKNITNLNVSACGFDDNALSYFLNMPSLKFLNISGNKQLTKKGIENFLSKANGKITVTYK